ncbi:efflux RND transporter periplasmic adaptor subunit [Chitinophaga sedimenti]|uniref:efflux RND transporter periplasmic adaptor subunit n=1 Tax=Chitinophaga sedimenti TaxID=2033606 RepID=UPI0020067B15|nr:HlyD family efflux transporter periplasmic adaptor subunit [Chitinophaga sedimenti]MCK7555901.1 efflux RND transporter periplasmic adaptor subunit [Chitinophaga sedimenti]
MDREISAEVNASNKRKWILVTTAIVVVIAAGIFTTRYFFKSSLRKSNIITAIVETGDVENTITASGEVLPEFEEVITSPVSSAIRSVLIDAGATVQAGQPVLQLDKALVQAAYDKGRFMLESKQNNLRKLKLELDKSYFDLKSSNDIKQLRINSLTAEVENTKRLFKAGGGTRESVEQAEMNLRVAQLEKTQLENEIRSKQQSMQVEIRESELEVAMQQHELQELGRKRDMANVSATRNGVVTWVNRNVGASVGEGVELVRIADLSSFKISGSIADSYLDKLRSGMPVIVRINDKQLRGDIASIYPAVRNGLVNFDVRLADRDTGLLRPNLKVDVFVVTDAHRQVLRVTNGAAFGPGKSAQLFVVQGDKAVRRQVSLGLSNFDYVELKDNVRAGETVIVSDMSDFKNTREITLIP